MQFGKDKSGLPVQSWIQIKNAFGILTRSGLKQGNYSHKYIVRKFTGWLNVKSTIEIYLVEEIQWLLKIEEQKNSYDLLNYDQILFLIRLKEVF
jgi:hypothetical protein